MTTQHFIYMIQQWQLVTPKEEGQTAEAAASQDEDLIEEPELNKQLRILITRLSTSIMIFAVIRQSLDHARHKNKPPGLRDVDYTDPNMQELMKATTIDSKTQNYCFIMTCLFFIDFISAWFDQYSKYFAGNRFDRVSNILERVIQQLYEFKIVFIVVGLLSEAYLMGQYMR